MVRCICCRSVAVSDPPRPAGPSSVQSGVELADHRVGEGLAEFVFVGLVGPTRWRRRAGRNWSGTWAIRPVAAAVFDDLAELVEQQVAVLRRVQGAVGAALPGDGVDDPGEVAGTQRCRVDPPGGGQGLGGGPAGAQRLAEPLQVGPGGAGPVLDRLPAATAARWAGNRRLPGSPASDVNRWGAGPAAPPARGHRRTGPHRCAGPRPGPGDGAGRGTTLGSSELYAAPPLSQTASGSASRSDGRPGQPAEQDPHLRRIDRQRGQVTLLQRVEHLDAHQLGQPGQAELVDPEPRLRRGHPPGQSTVRRVDPDLFAGNACRGNGRARGGASCSRAQPATRQSWARGTGGPGRRNRPPTRSTRDGARRVRAGNTTRSSATRSRNRAPRNAPTGSSGRTGCRGGSAS